MNIPVVMIDVVMKNGYFLARLLPVHIPPYP